MSSAAGDKSGANNFTKDQQQAISSLQELKELLKCPPGQQSKTDASKEAQLLEKLAIAFSANYDFTACGPTAEVFKDVFQTLVDWRVAQPEFRAGLREDHLLRVLQAVRLLTRDAALRHMLINGNTLRELCVIFKTQTELHFAGQITPFQVELLTELASIAKRLAGDEWGLTAMTQCDMHAVLVHLLASTDPVVVPLVLVSLMGFAAHRDHAALVCGPEVVHLLLRIIADYEVPFKRLAADLLALLARRESVVSELLEQNGLCRLVGQLAAGDSSLTASLLRVVCYQASDARSMQEIYQTGTVPVLLSLVSCTLKDCEDNQGLAPSRIVDMQLVCTALTRISEDDELAGVIRSANGVALLGRLLLLPTPETSSGMDSEKATSELSNLRAYVLRTLRFLFSVERNRKVFKRLFPPDLFAAFIDIGHYNASLTAYTGLAQRIEELGEKARSALASAFEDISVNRDCDSGAAEAIRSIKGGQYVLLDLLGKGAYGAVYKARRSRGDALVALKEVPLADVSLFGATPAEREQGAGRLGKEVDILSSLSHPHVVQYYEAFVEGPYLYISMELVEGVSLLDHINSLTEKGRRMPEQDIWQVLLAVCLGLHYIHSVAKVVHRDLTPANIMLGQGVDGLRHAKIADFGLAKRLSGTVITAHSVVGTMPYTCPEIIQQEEYSEKADVWSLGCVLYHCMSLKPPFDGSNPLSVASKIVEGSYESVGDPPDGPAYSLHIKQLQRLMMTVDPNKRPSMDEVAALISGQLMSALERLTASEQRLQRALALEKAHHKRANSAGYLTGGLDTPTSPMIPAAHPSLLALHANLPGYATQHQPASTASPARPAAGGQGTPFAIGTIRARRQMLEPLTAQTNSSALRTSGGGSTPTVEINPMPLASPHLATVGSRGIILDATNDNSCTTPSEQGISQVGFMNEGAPLGMPQLSRDPSNGMMPQGPGTPNRLVSLATSRLRPMHDPLTQMLAQLHKIMWIEQLPPGLTRDPRRRCVDTFKRVLFGPNTNATTLKVNLTKCQAGDPDVVRDVAGTPVLFGIAPMRLNTEGPTQPMTPSEGMLTYDQLAQVIEGLLLEKGYTAIHITAPSSSGSLTRTHSTGMIGPPYQGVTMDGNPGDHITDQQLPPSVFAAPAALPRLAPRRSSLSKHLSQPHV